MSNSIIDVVHDSIEVLDLVGFHKNYSFQVVVEDLMIPLNEQMTVHGWMDIEANVTLEGNLVIEI